MLYNYFDVDETNIQDWEDVARFAYTLKYRNDLSDTMAEYVDSFKGIMFRVIDLRMEEMISHHLFISNSIFHYMPDDRAHEYPILRTV